MKLELVPEDQLHPDSELGELRARVAELSANAADAQGKYQQMLDDQKELERLIATATLESTTPLDHATNKARLELLERSIKPIREISRSVGEGSRGARRRFDVAYSDYARLVREINEGGRMHDDRRAQLMREIAALTEPAGVSGEGARRW
jgi:chromosome segregation ATPase